MDDEDEDEDDEEDDSAAATGGDRPASAPGSASRSASRSSAPRLVIAFARADRRPAARRQRRRPRADRLRRDRRRRRRGLPARLARPLARAPALPLTSRSRSRGPLLILIAVVAFVARRRARGGDRRHRARHRARGRRRAVLLRGSYDAARRASPRRRRSIRSGAPRIPVVLSMWTIGNADIFILSRFVSDADLGIYQLASRTGFIVALLPGGFRVAMRPLRKSLDLPGGPGRVRAGGRSRPAAHLLLPALHHRRCSRSRSARRCSPTWPRAGTPTPRTGPAVAAALMGTERHPQRLAGDLDPRRSGSRSSSARSPRR